MNVVSLFSGIGGLELGLESLGFKTICYVENERYAQKVLVKNMEEGNLSRAPVWDDVKTFDGTVWKGVADLVCGGFPCQDISVAGKGLGIKEGTRSGLWFEFKRIICEVRPRYVLVENVSAITKRGLGVVLAGLSEVGYDAVWFTLQAAEVGALHRRERMFIVGWRNDFRNSERSNGISVGEICQRSASESERVRQNVADPESEGRECRTERKQGVRTQFEEGISGRSYTAMADSLGERGRGGNCEREDAKNADSRRERIGPVWDREWWSAEPDVGRVANGVPNRVDRLRCLGNGVVPQVAREVGKVILMLGAKK